MPKTEVVTIGGGRGHSVLVEGLTYQVNPENITAIVGMRDKGGDTGWWIENFGSPAVGDFKKIIAALAPSHRREKIKLWLNDRKNSNGHSSKAVEILQGRNYGNFGLVLAIERTGNLQTAIDEMMEVYGIEGRVLPLDFALTNLIAETKNGKKFIGEDVIDQKHLHDFDPNDPFIRFSTQEEAEINPEAESTLLSATRIVQAPGSLETSIIPIYLTKGVKEVLKRSKATKTMVVNLVTEPFNSPYHTVTQFIDRVLDFSGEGIFTHAVVNTKHPDEDADTQYAKRGQSFTGLDYDRTELEYRGIKIQEAELLSFSETPDYSFKVLQQDPEKLGRAVMNTFEPVRFGRISFAPAVAGRG